MPTIHNIALHLSPFRRPYRIINFEKKKQINKKRNKQARRENDAMIIFIPEDPIRLKVLRGVNQRLIIFKITSNIVLHVKRRQEGLSTVFTCNLYYTPKPFKHLVMHQSKLEAFLN